MKTKDGLFTEVLVDALSGNVYQILEISSEDGRRDNYVFPHPLGKYLEEEIPQRINKMHLTTEVNQEPDCSKVWPQREWWLTRIMRGIDRTDTESRMPPRLTLDDVIRIDEAHRSGKLSWAEYGMALSGATKELLDAATEVEGAGDRDKIGRLRQLVDRPDTSSPLRIHFRQFVGDVECVACAESSSG